MRIEAIVPANMTGCRDVDKHARLVDAAQQFEAMMLQEMLKPMHSGANSWDEQDKDADHSADTLSTYGTEAVAKAISKSGGLGIARKIVQQITQESCKSTQKEFL